MKKLYFLLVGICFFGSGKAQVIDIPDANFKLALVLANPSYFIAKDSNGNTITVDLNYNNEIEYSEALNVYELEVREKNITSLQGISFFTNLRSLNCLGNRIENLDIKTLINLKELNCFGNRLKNFKLSDLPNIETVYLSQNLLEVIILNNVPKLQNFYCERNVLSSLNLFGLSALEKIDCSDNKIVALKLDGLINLKSIDISNNLFGELNVSELNNLEELYCDTNGLLNLDLSKNAKLIRLACGRNSFENLSFKGLETLQELNYSGSYKTTNLDLKDLKNLQQLVCTNNSRLENIDLKGCAALQRLDCSINYKLAHLDLSDQINLNYLDCTRTVLKELNVNNCTKLRELSCGWNDELTAVYSKNNVFSYNYYFTPCRKLVFICTSADLVDHYRWIIGSSTGYDQIEINSYCSFNPGGTFYTIQGNTKLDTDNNGCDSNDDKFPNLNFSIADGINKGNIISNATGNYSIPVGEGTHTITPKIENLNYFTVSPSSISVTFPTQTSPFIQNFCIAPKGVHNDLEVTILPTIPARPGFDATYKIIYKNKGNQIQSGSVSLSFNDAVLDYVSAIPAISNQVNDKLSWDYTNLKPLESREITVTLNVNSPMETPAVNIGDRLSFNALINPVSGDEKPVDNSSALRQSVVGSFDPNDKTCLEGDIITPSLIGEYVNYLIRFENTGTYPAQNIVVKDLIDLTKFDISTLIPTKASHDFVTKISNGNKVEFIFENINLPFDNATNDGYIAFKIKTLPTLVVGDSFENEANIFFDYNFPVLTNKAKSTFKSLGTPDFEFSDYFSLYPNPVNTVLNIGTKNSIEVESIVIYDILGQIIVAIPDAATVSNIDVSKLTTGNYFLKMNTNKGTSSVKFIKK